MQHETWGWLALALLALTNAYGLSKISDSADKRRAGTLFSIALIIVFGTRLASSIL